MKLRRILFWIHLSAGVLAGIVVLIMSLTGVLLAYKQQISRWASRDYRVTHSEHLPLAELVAKIRTTQGAMPSAVTLRQDANAPAEFSFGRDRIVFVNPATAEVVGELRKLPAFFAKVEDIHRWLGTSNENRPVGEAITGACNLVFLVLLVTGPFIWWPKDWGWGNLKKIVWFRGSLKGRALYWNWHNVLGIWCVAPLILIVLTGTVMSYTWANNLLYRLTGNQPPQHNTGQANRAGSPNRERTHSDAPEFNLEKLVAQAQQQVTQWQSLTVRFPSGRGPLMLFADEGNGGRPDLRSQFIFDPKTSEVRWETFSSYNSGRRLRTWARFSHTGEAAGWFGETIAATASMGAVVLVFTGLTLSIKRLLAWKARRVKDTELSSVSS